MNDSEIVKNQYAGTEKLDIRIAIHSKYSTNKQGFGNWISSNYRIEKGMSVLELGCGTGSMWAGQKELINRCGRLVLTDISDGMVNKAKEALGGFDNTGFRVVDIQDIPFEDNSFDAVIANMMLYHVPDLQRGLTEVSRVLKADGTFYCATFGEHGMMHHIEKLLDGYIAKSDVDSKFTLQNGERQLKKVFPDVQMLLYEDSLEVTDADDMVDYIYSLNGMNDLRNISREEVRAVLESHMQDGVLRVPKEYGMFIARKNTV